MVSQLHFPRVAGKSSGLCGRDIEKHLLGIRGDHMYRPVADLHRSTLGMRENREYGVHIQRKAGGASCHNGLEALHRFLSRRPTNVARTVIVIISTHPTDFTVLLDARGPIPLIP